jgi:hypothetical protein
MTSRVSRVDKNQYGIICELRALGYGVQSIAPIGKGCPDIVVCHNGHNYLFELKSDKGKLTPDEIEWHADWISRQGQVAVVHSTEEIIDYIKQYKGVCKCN